MKESVFPQLSTKKTCSMRKLMGSEEEPVTKTRVCYNDKQIQEMQLTAARRLWENNST